nr:hypothetical protein 10 [bacterium]
MTFLDDMAGRDLAILETLDGREITYTPQGGEPRIISGMLQEFTEMVQGESVEVIGSSPVLSVRSCDVPEIQAGDGFTVSGVNYEVVAVQPDNENMTELKLEKL